MCFIINYQYFYSLFTLLMQQKIRYSLEVFMFVCFAFITYCTRNMIPALTKFYQVQQVCIPGTNVHAWCTSSGAREAGRDLSRIPFLPSMHHACMHTLVHEAKRHPPMTAAQSTIILPFVLVYLEQQQQIIPSTRMHACIHVKCRGYSLLLCRCLVLVARDWLVYQACVPAVQTPSVRFRIRLCLFRDFFGNTWY